MERQFEMHELFIRMKGELALLFATAYTWVSWFSESHLRWLTTFMVFIIAIVRLVRLFKGKDDDDFGGVR